MHSLKFTSCIIVVMIFSLLATLDNSFSNGPKKSHLVKARRNIPLKIYNNPSDATKSPKLLSATNKNAKSENQVPPPDLCAVGSLTATWANPAVPFTITSRTCVIVSITKHDCGKGSCTWMINPNIYRVDWQCSTTTYPGPRCLCLNPGEDTLSIDVCDGTEVTIKCDSAGCTMSPCCP